MINFEQDSTDSHLTSTSRQTYTTTHHSKIHHRNKEPITITAYAVQKLTLMADSQVQVGNITSAVLCCTRIIRFLDSSVKDKTSMPSLSFLRKSPDVEVVKRRTLCADAFERDPSFGWKNSFGYEKAVFRWGRNKKKSDETFDLVHVPCFF